MKSPGRAIGSAVVTSMIPFLTLFSGAIVALVWLRAGRTHGLKVLLAACLPGLYYWLAMDSPDVLLALLGSALLADLLREGKAWSQLLLVGALLAAVVALTLKWLPPELMNTLVTALMEHQGMAEQFSLGAADLQQLVLMLDLLLNGAITSLQLLMVLASVLLARWWQSLLYNPGGFQLEFHSIRLPAWSGLLLPVVLIMVAAGQSWLMPVIPVLLVPHLVAGIALVHGVFGIKKYNSFWLGLLYVSLLFAQPYMSVLLVLIALADSLMNFRHRLAPPPPPPKDGDGEA